MNFTPNTVTKRNPKSQVPMRRLGHGRTRHWIKIELKNSSSVARRSSSDQVARYWQSLVTSLTELDYQKYWRQLARVNGANVNDWCILREGKNARISETLFRETIIFQKANWWANIIVSPTTHHCMTVTQMEWSARRTQFRERAPVWPTFCAWLIVMRRRTAPPLPPSSSPAPRRAK